MTDSTIRIRKAPGTWVVRAGGAVLGESAGALEVSVGDDEARIFFPRDDIAMAFLDETESMVDAPGLGSARLLDIVTKSTKLRGAAQSVENPGAGAAAIAGHIVFGPDDRVAVEQV